MGPTSCSEAEMDQFGAARMEGCDRPNCLIQRPQSEAGCRLSGGLLEAECD